MNCAGIYSPLLNHFVFTMGVINPSWISVRSGSKCNWVQLRKKKCKSWLLAWHCMHCAAAATSFHTRWLPPKALTGPLQRCLQHSLLQLSLPSLSTSTMGTF